MAAVITPQPATAPWNRPDADCPAPRLRLVEGGAGARRSSRRRSFPSAALVAALGLLVVVVLAVWSLTSVLGADAAAPVPASTATAGHLADAGASTSSASAEVVVHPGDTLWSIARSLRPTGDVRPLVDELAARAGGVDVRPGQRIDVSGLAG